MHDSTWGGKWWHWRKKESSSRPRSKRPTEDDLLGTSWKRWPGPWKRPIGQVPRWRRQTCQALSSCKTIEYSLSLLTSRIVKVSFGCVWQGWAGIPVPVHSQEWKPLIPFPELWEWIFSFPSRSRISGMLFFHSLPVPELWEWVFFIPFPFPNCGNGFFSFPSRSRIVGMDFFNSLPIPEFAISQTGIKTGIGLL